MATTSTIFASVLTIESETPRLPEPPKKAVQFSHPRASSDQDTFELGVVSNSNAAANSADVEAFPSIPNEETSSDNHGSTSEQIQSIWNPYKNRFRVLASCMTAFGNGMNDSAPGALIASIERDYNIAYGTVSIIFVSNALGFVTAAFFINAMSTRWGRAKTLVIAEALLIAGYTAIAFTPPFPAVCASFFVLGVGMAMNLAIGQVFCANLANNTSLLGAFQGAYGIGGIIGPLIATAMISGGFPWSRFYIIELGLAVFNLIFSAWSFWKYELETDSELPTEVSFTGGSDVANNTSSVKSLINSNWKSFRTLISDKPTMLGACFIFAYQGAEVAISGWIISFLVQMRRGDPSKVGYVTSGFWAGITVGRFTLSFLAHRMGERPFVFIVTAGALVLELIIWFVPSIPGDSVAVAFSGLLLGPMYPSAVHIFQRLIPRRMQISSLSVIGSVGSAGGAVAPFMTGMLAQKVGTFVLHPICIGLFVAMTASWWCLPKPKRRDE